MFLGTLGGLSSCQKQFQTIYKEIVDNKFIFVDKAKIGVKKDIKNTQNSEIWNSNLNITGRTSAIGQLTGLQIQLAL